MSYSEPFSVTNGVKQGGVLSPIMECLENAAVYAAANLCQWIGLTTIDFALKMSQLLIAHVP